MLRQKRALFVTSITIFLLFSGSPTVYRNKKVWLEKGETKSIDFVITSAMLAHYDTSIHNWNVENDDFEVRIGNASDNITITKQFRYQSN